MAGRAPPEHAEQEGREQRRVDEGEHELQHVHDVVELPGGVGAGHADEQADHRGRAGPPQRWASVEFLVHVALVDVVGPDGVERGDVARHAGHERGHQRGQADAQHAVGEILREHGRHDHVVVGRAVGRRRQLEAGAALTVSAMASMPGRITSTGKSIFGTAARSGVRRAAPMSLAAIARCTTRKSVHQ